VPVHFVGPVNVPEIDDDRASHPVTQAFQIERTELLPFGGDDERIMSDERSPSFIALGM